MRPMRCVLLNQGIGQDHYFMWLALDVLNDVASCIIILPLHVTGI